MTVTDTRRAVADRAAWLLTEIFAPAHLVIALLLIVGAASHDNPLRGVAWGALAAFIVGVIPYAWMIYAVRRGRFTSIHVPERAQRFLPYAVALIAVVAGVAILGVLEAPRQLIALVIAMLAGLAITGAITTKWKISLHIAVAAGTSTILTIVFGPILLTSAFLVAAIGWSRIHVHGHTPPQVTLGAALGAVVAVSAFLPLY